MKADKKDRIRDRGDVEKQELGLTIREQGYLQENKPTFLLVISHW